jgi:hypothetical protein|tara:strand:+ start:3258 stop:3431 length:174 start_codon:yes stop_codon:yes gene_type:complete
MMFKINSMVSLKIGEDDFIGQVVSIENDVYLIRIFDNMHYHATLSELKPFQHSSSSL